MASKSTEDLDKTKNKTENEAEEGKQDTGNLNDQTEEVEINKETALLATENNSSENEHKNVENKKKTSNVLSNLSEEREIKPKKIPIGGLKLPGFFMKPKTKTINETDTENLAENLNVTENTEAEKLSKSNKSHNEEGKLTNIRTRLRNFVGRKSTAAKKQDKTSAVIESTKTDEAKPQNCNGDESYVEDEKAPLKSEKRSLIHIKLADALGKKKKRVEDVELGISKAGLASVETLNESSKEQDCTDSVPGNKQASNIKKSTQNLDVTDVEEKRNNVESFTFWENLRTYTCSIDDVLIVLGMLLFLLLVSVICFLLSRESLTSSPLRQGLYIDAVTSCGMVEGIKEDGSFAFRRIPFSLPPTGERRWQPAQLIENIDDCWKEKLITHNISEVKCMQLETNDLNGTQLIGSEDCLYLDIITPHVRYDNFLPVVVLIGADTFTGPSPGILRPSSRYARSHDVVFVRPNFRLGALGFLALNTLSKRAYPHSSGNYALTDIIAALEWIQLNIRHFGGNPEMVTLLGHRAGATLVSALVTSPAAQSLFARAWVSSPSAIFPGKPLSYSEERNKNIMHVLNCLDSECLLNATAEEIWSATPDSWLHSREGLPALDENASVQQHEWLVLDGTILQRHPAEYWKEQAAIGVPEPPKFVMGTTLHEMHSNKLRDLHGNWTAEDISKYIETSRLGELNLTREAEMRYNCTNYNQLIALITDIRSTCPLIINARIQPSILFYLVTQGENQEQLALVGADVLAILGRYEPHTVEERRFVSSMQQLFYYYVAHGSIPLYDPRRRVVKIGQDPLPVEDHEHCNFWISKDIVPRFARD